MVTLISQISQSLPCMYVPSSDFLLAGSSVWSCSFCRYSATTDQSECTFDNVQNAVGADLQIRLFGNRKLMAAVVWVLRWRPLRVL